MATVDDTTPETDGAVAVQAWRDLFSADDKTAESFWKAYDPVGSSIWTMVYDEADSNESVEQTIEIVDNFMSQGGMTESIRKECFGIMYTLGNLEIKGLWLFKGEDPEILFGNNEETSWFSWSRLGPEATDKVKEMVDKFLIPVEGKLDGQEIKDVKTF